MRGLGRRDGKEEGETAQFAEERSRKNPGLRLYKKIQSMRALFKKKRMY
jgi:hypothetical protein